MLEFTYVMIKPDIMKKQSEQRNLIFNDIIDTFYNNGLEIVTVQQARLTEEQAKKHYEHLKDKPFFGELTNFMTSGDVFEMILLGEDAVSKVRELIGPTSVIKAKVEAPTSIRAKYGDPNFGSMNAIHASDSKENAIIEIKRFFNIELIQPCLSETKINALIKNNINMNK